MKKNRKWLRITALVLAMVCLVSAVFAATFDASLDLSGDNKINVWDIQLAVNDGKTEDARKILTGALGSQDELNPNTSGVYEIHTTLGLYNMAKNANKGYSFKLMANIDLNGADWTPVLFKGNFDGNGKTISNMKITKGVTSTYADGTDMGFFSMIDRYTAADGATVQSQVTNLNLENVQITAVDNAWFIGLIAGSNRGKVVNCTATGHIADTRTTLPAAVYVGAMVGRNNSATNTYPAGTVTGGTTLLSEDVVAKMSRDFGTLSYPEGTATEQQYTRTWGIVGTYKDKNIDQTLLWQDTSNSTSLLPEKEQNLRNTVEQKMYQMGTVEWTPSETVTFTRYNSSTGAAQPSHTHSNAFLAGETYTGIPYVPGYNGSFERFMSQMEEDEQGNLTTVTGLENGTRYQTDNRATGMICYMGNNCSVAVGWAWAAVSPTRVYNDEVTDIYGGAAIRSAYYMVPTTYNIEKYGTLPVSGYEIQAEKYDSSYFEADTACVDTRDTSRLIETLGAQRMAEAYAQTHKGDAITFADYQDETIKDGVVTSVAYEYDNSHIRLVAADPVIIRDWENKIDLERSYVLTHEQGDGLMDNKDASGNAIKTYTDSVGTYNVKYTSWRIYHKYTLSVLLTQDGYKAAKEAYSAACEAGKHDNANSLNPGCGWGYVPVTMRAYTNSVSDRAPYYSEYSTHPVTLPNTGWFYSNYWAISGTMTIKDKDTGEVVYNQTKYLLDRELSTGFSTVKLDQDFDDAEDNLVEGKTYTMTLSFLASNGKTTYIKPSTTGKPTWTGSTTNQYEVEFVYEKVTDTTTPENPEEDDGVIEDSGNE